MALWRVIFVAIFFLSPRVLSAGFMISESYTGLPNMTKVEAFLISETGQGGFESPGIAVGGVNGVVVSSTYAVTSGSISGDGSIDLFLTGNPAGTLIVDILMYGPGNAFNSFDQDDPFFGYSGRFTFTNGTLSVVDFFTSDHDLSQYDRGNAAAAVPEPASMAIWGLGALGCAVAGYRRRKLAA